MLNSFCIWCGFVPFRNECSIAFILKLFSIYLYDFSLSLSLSHTRTHSLSWIVFLSREFCSWVFGLISSEFRTKYTFSINPWLLIATFFARCRATGFHNAIHIRMYAWQHENKNVEAWIQKGFQFLFLKRIHVT